MVAPASGAAERVQLFDAVRKTVVQDALAQENEVAKRGRQQQAP